MITRLSDIIDSDHQAELLAFFLTATPRSFPVSELSRRLAISHKDIAQAAAVMEKHNLVRSFTKQQTKFYILNHRHAMIPQLKSSLGKEHKSWPDELSASLRKLGNFSGIFLSGVFVGRPELVIDLLLVGSVNTDKLSVFLRTTSKQFGGELNYSIMSAQEFKLRRDTFDRFIKDVFDYPHITLLDKSDEKQDVKEPVVTEPAKAAKPAVKSTSKKPASKPANKVVKKKAAKKPVAKKQVIIKKTPAKKKLVVKSVAKAASKPAKKLVKKPITKPVKKVSQKLQKKAVKKAAPKPSNKHIKKVSKKTGKKRR